MKMIKCRRCGTMLDTESGVCPSCGAAYFVLSETELKEPPIPETELDAAAALKTEIDPELEEILRETRGVDATQTIYRRPNSQPTQQQRPTQKQPTQQPQYRQQPTQQQRPSQQQQYRQQPTQQSGQQQRRPSQQQQQYRQPAQRPRNTDDDYSDVRPRRSGGNGGDGGNGNKKPKTKNIIIIAIISIIAIIALVIIISSIGASSNKDETIPMPSVVGMTEDEARDALEELELTVLVSYEASDEALGTVISQSLKENRKVTAGDTVRLVISSGEAEEEEEDVDVSVPNLVGKDYSTARTLVSNVKLNLARADDQYSSTVAAGQIISQSPSGGATAKAGDTVTVVVSKGAEPTPTFTITVTSGKGGTISPKGAVAVEKGTSKTFTITPDSGYEIRELKIDGTSVGVATSYTFSNVTANHTIYAVFQEITATPSPSPSTDSSTTE